MPTIIPPSFGLVSHSLRLSGGSNPSGPMVVTYGVNVGIGGGQAVLDTCVDYFGSVVENICSSAYEAYLHTIKVGPNATGPTFENVEIKEGDQAAEPVFPQVAGLVKKTTGVGGRANRGRLYLPGLPVTTITVDGTIGSTALGNYNTVLATWLSGLEGEGINMFILHSGSSDPTEVTGLTMESKVATQRRRMR